MHSYGGAFAWKHLLVFMHTAQCHFVYKCNTIGLNSVCFLTAFVPKFESGEWADVAKIELGKQREKAEGT